MEQSIPVIRRVRFKHGGASLEVIRSRKPAGVLGAEAEFRATMAAHGTDIVGIVVLLWGKDGTSTIGLKNTVDSPIVSALLPEFARFRVEAEIVERWTRQGLNQ